jgi:DHA2 family multidrug resistance protein
MGYTAETAGLVLSGASMVILFEMPIVGQLTTKIPAKYIMAFGWVCLGLGMLYSTKRLDLLISFGAASQLRIAQAFGLGFLFVPISLSAYTGIPAEKGNSVSGLVNFMRNIGSSVGTSMVTTLLARRAQVHQVALSQHTSRFDRSLQNEVKAFSLRLVHSGVSVADAPKRAYGLLYQSVERQAQTLAYIDIFLVLTVAASIMFLLSFIVRKNDPKAGGVAVG